ncbi:MAG: glycerol acyltransferase, partial [Spirochaetia bacterium]|nr:glycerol acyltransferase [Spirochaetia bacterium]
MRAHTKELPDIAGYFDPEFTRRMAEGPLRLLNHAYFRAKIVGLDNVPDRAPGDNPRIFYSNHSGMSFPWDAMVFATYYWEQKGFKPGAALRALVAPMLSATKVMNPFMIDNMWKRCGGVDATLVNFQALMEEKAHDVLIYPEGVPGIGKGFDRRYQIQQFSTSFLRMAVKNKADVVPFYTINAEYTHPFSYRNDTLNSWVQKLGIPFLPLSPLTALVPSLPYLFYFGLPARMTFIVDKPISVWKEFQGRDPDSIKRNEFTAMRDQLTSDFQAKITHYAKEHGEDPFDLPGLVNEIKDRWNQLPFLLPSGWPLLFLREFKSHLRQTKSP